ncbi:Spo0E family sporulation regulatory protein-aspartic acid phosphatase [Metabacillus sp. BG109]|uniref:Spo0E family sporulation regulatory protein-aspartic acid phosphatase n=2 Tax=Metabacillus bambusae TaxID=2795218 RepID=A0ABS3N346_9BACI|nr:Spo0E family sporulation regulatory protein-aspartic acid phosphatase [Metabacillus bambusae]
MLIIAKENGIDSHLTLIASQNLDQLLNIKMNEKSAKLTKKKPLNNFLLHQ